MRKRAPNAEDEEEFEFPAPPQYIEPSILREAEEWRGLDEFDAALLQLGGGFGDAAIDKFTRGVDFPKTDKTSFDFHKFLSFLKLGF